MRDPEGRDKSRFCEYHRDVGHRTNDWYHLYRILNYLVKRGHLREYVEEAALNSSQSLPHTSSHPVIDTILVGPASPKTQGQPRSGIFMAGVYYIFALSSIRPIDGLITFSESPLRVLVSFNGPHTNSLGKIVLLVSIGPITTLVPLTVIDEPSSFNTILGRT